MLCVFATRHSRFAFSALVVGTRRKSYMPPICKWFLSKLLPICPWTRDKIFVCPDVEQEKTCKLLRRLLYRNGFVLCSILASPIFVWRNGVWQRRRLFHRPYPRFPNLYRCNIIKTVSFQSGIRLRSFQT